MQQLEALPFRPQGTNWTALEARLTQLNRRAAIVGPQGSGKTTLLQQLGERLEADGYRTRWIQITRDRRRFSKAVAHTLTHELTSRDVILFDGAGHLLPWRWWAFQRRARKAGGLIITAHWGRRLPILLRTQTDPVLLQTLMDELLTRADAPPQPTDAIALHRRHRGNLRTALREVYDQYAHGARRG
ncbi:MAG: hypothetical protein WD294_01175 [Phycisphaeraceae bacterium]